MTTQLEKQIITWNDLHHHVKEIYHRLYQSNILQNTKAIIALSRGGLVPATILANKADIKNIYSLGVRSYQDQEQKGIEYYPRNVKGYIENIASDLVSLPGNNIVIVDELIDTGETMKSVVELFEEKFRVGYSKLNIFIVAPYYKEFKGAKFTVPFFYNVTYHKDIWLEFPWES